MEYPSFLEPLPLTWFRRDAAAIAPQLVGRCVVVRRDGRLFVDMITETEAYLGPEDAASHARFGPTPRARVMFDTIGHWYLYFIYGMHTLANITCNSKGAGAVLLRGIASTQGPGRVVRQLGLTLSSLNGKPAVPGTGVWITKRRFRPARTVALPRVGIAYAADPWREAPLRFVGRWKGEPTRSLAALLQRYGAPRIHLLGHQPLASRGR